MPETTTGVADEPVRASWEDRAVMDAHQGDALTAGRTGAVSKKLLSEQVRQILLEQILRGDYQPGERLVETRLAKELGVSQGTVREALRALEGLGFVESAAYRGVHVRGAVSYEEMAAIHPVRAVLEDLAATTSVAPLASDPSGLRSALAAMRQAARLGDPRSYSAHSASFHRTIVVASGNAALVTAWESLGVEARLLITTLTTVNDLSEAAERHAPILAAVEARDVETVRRLLREHQNTYQQLPHDQSLTMKSGSPAIS
jgi:DNA-binding GntR family transcriptional regulator